MRDGSPPPKVPLAVVNRSGPDVPAEHREARPLSIGEDWSPEEIAREVAPWAHFDWYIFRTPGGGRVLVPVVLDYHRERQHAQAREKLRQTAYKGAPVEEWPHLGIWFQAPRSEVVKAIMRGDFSRPIQEWVLRVRVR